MIYEEYNKSSLWDIIEQEIKSLENNQDLNITTRPDYITGAIVKRLHEAPIIIEKIAETLWKVHSHSLYPYYVDKHESEESWNSLEEDEIKQGDVSKNFFRQIAKEIFSNKI